MPEYPVTIQVEYHFVLPINWVEGVVVSSSDVCSLHTTTFGALLVYRDI